jgi:tetratricopeptide (TPR) repeat protein
MRSALGENSNILVWRDSPELRDLNVTIGSVEGVTPEAQTQSADQMAARLHANMVIFGGEQSGPDGREFVLQFYLAPREGTEYADIQGGFDLGCHASLEDQSGSFYIIPTELESYFGGCASALAQITLGLSEAELGHSLEALEAFQKASDYFTTSEVIQFLIGREYLFLVDRESVLNFVRNEFYAQAAQAFTVAAELNPEYPRAHSGLGSVYFKQARDLEREAAENLAAGVNADEQLDQALQLVDRAIGEYDQALELSGKNLSDIPLESVARQGQGNALKLKGDILLDQGQAEVARQYYQQAVQALEPTIEPFEQAGQARYLAQTYEYLGSAFLWLGSVSEQMQAYPDGVAAYQSALKYLDLCIAQAESTQDFIIKTNIVAEACQPNREFVQERIALLGGTQ